MTQQTYKKDYNITIDNEGAAPQVYLAGSSGTTSIAGNLNINVKNAKSFALFENLNEGYYHPTFISVTSPKRTWSFAICQQVIA